MAQETQIPPFPNLRNADDVNYTECFDVAREGRIADMTVDLNDSNQNPKTNPPPPPPPTKTKTEGHRPVKASNQPDPQQYKDKVDDGSSHQKSSRTSNRGGPSPLHPAHESKPTRKDGANPPPPALRYPTHNSRHRQHKDQRDDGSTHRRPSKVSSRGPSPLHPTHESKSPWREGPNPFAERVPSDGRGSHTPGRGRRKHAGGQGSELLFFVSLMSWRWFSLQQKEDHYAIPPLPNFDENNASNITDVFKKAKADLSSASPNVHAKPTYQTTKNDKSSQKSCSCCAVM